MPRKYRSGLTGTLFVLMLPAASHALPHYFANLTGGGPLESGQGAMIMNQSRTGAAVAVSGFLESGNLAPATILVEGATVPRFSPEGNLMFFYQGTIYFSGPCCGSVSVAGLSGNWLFDYDPDIPPPPPPPDTQPFPNEPRGNYFGVGTPPPDIPEPGTMALLALGFLLFPILRRRW